MTTENIISQHSGLAGILPAGHAITYSIAAGTGGWFADLRGPDGRCVETGMGATEAEALTHLVDRLERGPLAGMLGTLLDALAAILGELLDEDCSVTFGRDAADGSYFADVMTMAGVQLSGSGDTPAAALRAARDSEEDAEGKPYCATCGEPIGHFLGYQGWHHFRGNGTAAAPVKLYDAGHAPVITWRLAGGQ